VTAAIFSALLLHRGTVTEYCDEHVYKSVCLFACSSNFLCVSPVIVARSSFGDVVIRHVFPVLWMTSCISIMGRMAASRYQSRLAAMLCTNQHPCCVALVASCPRRRTACTKSRRVYCARGAGAKCERDTAIVVFRSRAYARCQCPSVCPSVCL